MRCFRKSEVEFYNKKSLEELLKIKEEIENILKAGYLHYPKQTMKVKLSDNTVNILNDQLTLIKYIAINKGYFDIGGKDDYQIEFHEFENIDLVYIIIWR
ncbi:MAG: hypothetical protein KDK36_05940 [Leptospiraceae bacterium]|nr:hypothetical protein [Leptospiraceae bacterium]